MPNYSLGTQLKVKVKSRHSFGIFVRLPDGAEGYIRRRELDLNPRRDPLEFAVDAELSAVIIKIDAGLELSRRRTMPEPWDRIGDFIQLDDVVQVRVTSYTERIVFVEIFPGVSGIIAVEDLAPWAVARPEEIVFVDDILEAVVNEIDLENRTIKLSVNRRLQQHKAVARILQYFPQSNPVAFSPMISAPQDIDIEFDWGISREHINKLPPILVIDDFALIADEIRGWLITSGWNVETVYDFSSAYDSVNSKNYTAIILDLNLGDQDGLGVLKAFPTIDGRPPIILITIPSAVAARANEIAAAKIDFVLYKPFNLRSLDEVLYQIVRGDKPNPAVLRLDDALHAQKLLQVMFELGDADQPISVRIQNAMRHLRQTTQAQFVLLFERRQVDRRILVKEVSGLRNPAKHYRLYELEYTPINNVMQDHKVIIDNDVRLNRQKFDKLLELFDFTSCIALPVLIDGECNHALFFFHLDPHAFSLADQQNAIAGATLLSAILEAEIIDLHVQKLGSAITKGELVERLLHEVRNGMQGIQSIADNLRRANSLESALGDADRLAAVLQQLLAAIKAFESSRGSLLISQINLISVVEDTVRLMKYVVQKYKAEIILTRAPNDISPVKGSSVAVQLILINLILNAVQQISILREHDDTRSGYVELSLITQHEFAEIRVRDNGPGIHRNNWKQVFSPGFTTRVDGSGLGLNIARSFVRAMEGSIEIEESIVLVGTTFLVKLPLTH